MIPKIKFNADHPWRYKGLASRRYKLGISVLIRKSLDWKSILSKEKIWKTHTHITVSLNLICLFLSIQLDFNPTND